MEDIQKKEFTLRISQANRTQLTVIIFEMALAYLDSAKKTGGEAYRIELMRARKCVDELKHSLDFTYEIAGMLLHLYIQINKLLVRASVSGRREHLLEAETALEKLKDAFVQVAKEDNGGPVLENAQAVYAGYTYGKTDLNVNLDGNSSGRGFLA